MVKYPRRSTNWTALLP